MKSIQLRIWLVAVAAMWLVSACQPVMAASGPRTIKTWVGGGQDTESVQAILPQTLHVRAGDTVTWQLEGDEIHTVSFLSGGPWLEFAVPIPEGEAGELMLNPQLAFPSRLPGAPVEVYDGTNFVSSGVLSQIPPVPDAPANEQFTATFSTPGMFRVNCLIHPWMTALVVVHEPTDANVPSQTEIDAQVESERNAHLADIEAARQQGSVPQSEVGPNDATLWYVRAGGLNVLNGNQGGSLLEFLPKDLTVQAGDTVIWSSAEFHSITFDPVPPAPEFILPQLVEGGPPILQLNPEILAPAKPSAVYDPAQYYNSADIGPYGFFGSAWTLTFAEPGTYTYFCAFHREAGMEGTITVE